jgi:N-acetylmuramoyl-L-alanine amidase CwlA
MYVKEMLLSKNIMTRTGEKLEKIKNIYVYNVDKQDTSALSNLEYIENLSKQSTTFYSVHYIIGVEGEIIRCIPNFEMAWHSKNLKENKEGISIVCCYRKDGELEGKTLESLEKLISKLCSIYNLDILVDVKYVK